ncbi:MAG: hypothetical protein C0601_10545 [Candidatus Muiribacterium halophilum]|uniref:Uncharacterized protein n=1 Tax=Muiribacterium halophilum TaxID=2053465 RepID=A0A2N5ZC67_MUIH1|nr:MAG: hypothetical protein C0601_10545 [Candidatus Muirbacterium halophilum]
MIIDAWTYSFLLKELKEILFKDDQNPYLTQIKVVDSFSFLFIFMTANGVKKLLIDTRYSLQCLFILDKGKNIEKATISRKAEHMKMTMRKHIKNHKLIDIYQYKDERLFVFDFDHKKIILELMGQNYNLVLCDKEWIVLSCLRTSDNVYPSNKYIFPEKALETDFYNIDDLKSSKSVFKKTRKSLEKIIDISKTSAFLSYNEQKQKILSPIQINETSKEYLSFNKILNKIYSDDKKELLQERILYRTEKDILSDINKIDKKINNIPKKEESKNKIEEYKKNGELLKSNYHILNDNQGQKVIKIFDYVEEIEKEVRIWPELKPDEVIQKYFDLYKKEKRAL